MIWLKRFMQKRRNYSPLITIGISRSILLSNLMQFSGLIDSRTVSPVLKSNAYGHGLLEIASILDNYKSNGVFIPFFTVDSYFEAHTLRVSGIKSKVLIIGYTRPEDIINSRTNNISFSITSIDQLRILVGLLPNSRKRINIQIKVDTGMNRQGIKTSEIAETIQIIKQYHQKINLEGIFSHLCDADNIESDFTNKQIDSWNVVAKKFRDEIGTIKYWHLSATDGSLFNKKIDCNLMRIGIGLYGITMNDDLNSKMHLKPVLEMKAIITGIKKVKAGESIGYGNTFIAKKDMLIATIPVGYFEGLNRRLSNKGIVRVKGRDCSIVGRVSMNITTIDVSNIPNIKLEDEVVVISNNSDHRNSIINIARMSETIGYEVAVKIPQHLKRLVVE